MTPPIRFSSEVLQQARGVRLDVFLAQALEKSRSQIQEWLLAGAVTLNGSTQKAEASYRLRGTEEIAVIPPMRPRSHESLEPENIPLAILHEDRDILVLNKPPGLVVHPAAGNYTGTLVHALLHHCGAQLAQRGGEERLGIVHRLDKETSGVMVVAKTDKAHEKLADQFQSRVVKKIYTALAWGRFQQRRGQCRGNIGRHPHHRQKMTVLRQGGRSAHTDYVVKEQWEKIALVECQLHTGRTHQIRVHLAHLGHPIVGDSVYGRSRNSHDIVLPARQMLHATTLGFFHPRHGKAVEFSASLPEDFQQLIKQLHGSFHHF